MEHSSVSGMIRPSAAGFPSWSLRLQESVPSALERRTAAENTPVVYSSSSPLWIRQSSIRSCGVFNKETLRKIPLNHHIS